MRVRRPPAERFRVQRLLAADESMSAQAATRRVRTEQAARRLAQLRRALHARDQEAARPGALADRRARAAERRAHAALTRAGFSDPAVAADVLRQVQVLTRTAYLARLDYSTAEPARDAIASLITAVLPPGPAPPALLPAAPSLPGQPPPRPAPAQETARETEPADNQQAAGDHDADAGGEHDGEIIAAAAGILAEARQHGERLSQKALGGKLRRDGYRVANHSLRDLLAAASGQAEASPPPEPAKTPGGPVAPDRPVNGSYTPLASHLSGHEPGSGHAGPPGAW
jgi:hypothetical protein